MKILVAANDSCENNCFTEFAIITITAELLKKVVERKDLVGIIEKLDPDLFKTEFTDYSCCFVKDLYDTPLNSLIEVWDEGDIMILPGDFELSDDKICRTEIDRMIIYHGTYEVYFKAYLNDSAIELSADMPDIDLLRHLLAFQAIVKEEPVLA